MFRKIVQTDSSSATILIRMMVGLVFFTEGLQKFMFPDKLGAGRFAKIGLPDPAFLAPFAGAFEIACGFLLLIGLTTRLAAIPLLCVISVAIATTKVQFFYANGFWPTLHEGRADWAMLMGLIFLLIKGGGKWSFDNLLWNK